jgi:hypothetical protein
MRIVPVGAASMLVAALSLSCANTAAQAKENKALQQLQNATTGNQSTGVTFDGGKTPTDAYPKGNTNVPAVTGAPVANSTGTASGFSVETSSGTKKSK